MGSKKFKNKTCVYCGKENASLTGDHVFAREFFLEGQRANLPQVPACQACNNKKSELEHYLTAVLPFGGLHADSDVNCLRWFQRDLIRIGRCMKNYIVEMKRGWFETASGLVIESTVIPIKWYGGIELVGDNNYPNERTSIFGAVTANKHDIKDMARSYLDQISIAVRWIL